MDAPKSNMHRSNRVSTILQGIVKVPGSLHLGGGVCVGELQKHSPPRLPFRHLSISACSCTIPSRI